jgi:hypothetical protein
LVIDSSCSFESKSNAIYCGVPALVFAGSNLRSKKAFLLQPGQAIYALTPAFMWLQTFLKKLRKFVDTELEE